MPLGRRFDGIVHVHGDVLDPRGMVLTDKDFGRAYLTDGHMRGFSWWICSEAFDVLFVGYSHNDTVMSYLARALPQDQTRSRFSLTGDEDGDWWRFLGIEPVFYDESMTVLMEGLPPGVSGLADNLQRGNLDWQQRIAAVAGRKSRCFLDDEETDLIEDALSDAVQGPFLHPGGNGSRDWVDWLARRGYLGWICSGQEISILPCCRIGQVARFNILP